MKRILFLAALISAVSVFSFAQQRVTLVEHFTGANCGPCFDANPKVDPTYASNFPNVIVIKYQIPVTTMDILSAENYLDASDRSTYYSNQSVPHVYIDGKYKTGDPRTVITNSNLQTAYERGSDWEINVDYEIVDNEKVKVTMDMKSLVAQTGDFVAHIVLIEKEVNYDVAPGSNTETNFKYVMRKMLPTAAGSQLESSWAADQDSTIVEEVDIPLYFRDLEELAVVAFIQNNTSKMVYQAAYAESKTYPDAVNVEIVNMEKLNKDNNIPKLTVKSNDITNLTSANFKLVYEDGTIQSYDWTGQVDISGEGGEIILEDFPFDVKQGAYKYKVILLKPNGFLDVKMLNSTFTTDYVTVYAAAEKKVLPFMEDFEYIENGQATYGALENSIFVDYGGTGFNRILISGASWKLGANNSEAAILFRNIYVASGNKTDYFFPTLNVEDETELYLSYFYAYSPRNVLNNDSLLVHVSTDGGDTWNELVRKSSAELNTIGKTTPNDEFLPNASNLWKREVVLLDEYAGSSSLIFRFRGVSGSGNTLALDQIEITNERPPVSLPEIPQNVGSFDVFIHNGNLNVNFALTENANTNIKLYNITGNEVYAKDMGGLTVNAYSEVINVSNLNKGIYLIVLNVGGENITQKVVIR